MTNREKPVNMNGTRLTMPAQVRPSQVPGFNILRDMVKFPNQRKNKGPTGKAYPYSSKRQDTRRLTKTGFDIRADRA